MLHEDEVVLLIHMRFPLRSINSTDIFHPNSTLHCVFTDQFSAPMNGTHSLRGHLAIAFPLVYPNWVDFCFKESENGTIMFTVSDHWNILYPFFPLLVKILSCQPIKWNFLVYESSV